MIVRLFRHVRACFSRGGGGGVGGGGDWEAGDVAGEGDLRGVVAKLFYRYGLFTAWHPHTLASVVLMLAIYLSAPLVSVHLPSYWSHSVYVPTEVADLPHTAYTGTVDSPDDTPVDGQSSVKFDGNEVDENESVWYRQKPYIHLLQVVVRSGVVPWSGDLAAEEAYRSSLTLAFHLTETVTNFQHNNISLMDVCFRVDEPILSGNTALSELLPRYNCLVLSPALIWKNSLSNFASDTSPGKTIRQSQREQFCSGYSVCDLMFGLHTRSSAFTLTASDQRPVVTFSISLLLNKVDIQYVTALRHHLTTLYPAHATANTRHRAPTVHWYFPLRRSLLLPLCVLVFCALLAVYMYFSLRKMPALHGKRRMAVYTMTLLLATVAASCGQLTLYDGGWSRSGGGRGGSGGLHDWWLYCYPLLLGFVSFENAVRLTSVLMVADVPVSPTGSVAPRVRLARAVGGGGRWLVSNFVQQMALLSVGLCSGVPLVRRVCLPAAVGLLCDILLQLGFFLPLLCADARRQLLVLTNCATDCPLMSPWSPRGGDDRHTHDQYTCQVCLEHAGGSDWPVSSGGSNWTGSAAPSSWESGGGYWRGGGGVWSRRVRLFVMWSRLRLVQRVVSCLLVATMLWAAYNTTTLGKWHAALSPAWTAKNSSNNSASRYSDTPATPTSSAGDYDHQYLRHGSEAIDVSRISDTQPSPHFWAALLRVYNVSVQGHRLTLLPAVRLSVPLTVEQSWSRFSGATAEAAEGMMTDPDRPPSPSFSLNTAALRHSSDHPKFTDDLGSRQDRSYYWAGDYIVFFDGSKDLQDYALLFLLTLPSLVLMVYVCIRLYRCLCPRDYAQWRSSWRCSARGVKRRSSPGVGGGGGRAGTQRGSLTCAPLRLLGHRRSIECLVHDEQLQLLVSCCLRGEVRVWQPGQGRCLRVIDRELFLGKLAGDKSECDDNVFATVSPAGEALFGNEDRAGLEQKLRHRRRQYRSNSLENQRHEIGSPENQRHEIGSSGNQNHEIGSLGNQNHEVGSPRNQNHEIGSPGNRNHEFGNLENQRDEANLCSSAINDISDSHITSPLTCLSSSSPSSRSSSSAEPDVSRTWRCSSAGASGTVTASPGLQTVWCLDFCHLILVAAGSAGRIEVWDTLDTRLLLHYGGIQSPVTHVRLLRSAVCAFRLDGSITVHKLVVFRDGSALSWSHFTDIRSSCLQLLLSGRHYKTHLSLTWSGHCTVLAHQLPLSAVRVSCHQQLQLLITASADCTLKVYGWSEEQQNLSEQHHLVAHCAPVTSCCVDNSGALSHWRHVASGSADGSLCVWDLMTGVCLYSMLAHDGCVLSLSTSESCLLSMGGDGRLCVWERYAGTLISTVPLSHCYCPQSLMLSPSVCVTTRQGSLVFWDIELGKPIRLVKLGDSDSSVFVQQMALLDGAVACDYGCEIRVVRFPRNSGSSSKTSS